MARANPYSKKTNTWTDRNGVTSSLDGLDITGRNDVKGLLASDVSGLIEVRANNAREIEQAIDQAIARALEAIGLQAEGYAKADCPVDTGRLRNSITHQVSTGDNTVVIGTNVEYARFVEEDSHGGKRKGRHFLKKAAENHGGEYRKILESMLKNG